MKVLLEATARSEMWEAAQFYEDCRDGLGQEFLDAVYRNFSANLALSLWNPLIAA